MVSAVYRLLDRFGTVLLPPRCVLCQGPGGVAGRDLCADCEADLPWLAAPCQRCGLPGSTASHETYRGDARPQGCGHCRGHDQPHRSCHAPFLYEFPLTELVPSLKYQGRLANARVLGTLLAESLVRAGLHREVEVIVPMPLHRTRLMERGFNQALELACCAGAVLRLEPDAHALRRTRATGPQVGLSRAERSHNVQGAFVAQVSRVQGRRVALLDDVVTTGATVAEAAAALLSAGAVTVDVWCVARATG